MTRLTLLPQHFEDLNRPPLSFQLKLAAWTQDISVRQSLSSHLADQNLTSKRLLFQLRGKIHRIADRRIIRALRGAHVAHRDVSRIDAGAHAHGGQSQSPQIVVQHSKPLLHGDGRADRFQRGIGVLVRNPEERHQAVADEFVQYALVLEYHGSDPRKNVVQYLEHRVWSHRFSERGESSDIGKENCRRLANASQTDCVRVRQNLIHYVLRQEALISGPRQGLLHQLRVRSRVLGSHRGRRRKRIQEIQMIRVELLKRVSAIYIDQPQQPVLARKRNTHNRMNALDRQRLRLSKPLIGPGV